VAPQEDLAAIGGLTVLRARLSPDRNFVGTCAWSFDDWRGVFYPHALPRNRWLEDHGAAWVWADDLALGDEKYAGFGFLPLTARHLYVRLLGDFRTKYAPDGKETHGCGRLLRPRETALEHWAVKLRHHADAAAIYLFANNHYGGTGIETARRMAGKLGVSLSAATTPPGQLDLFGSSGAG